MMNNIGFLAIYCTQLRAACWDFTYYISACIQLAFSFQCAASMTSVCPSLHPSVCL